MEEETERYYNQKYRSERISKLDIGTIIALFHVEQEKMENKDKNYMFSRSYGG